MLQRRAKDLDVSDDLLSQSVDQDSLEAVRTSMIQLIEEHSSVGDSCTVSPKDEVVERCILIDALIGEGERLIRRGVFSLPKLSWDAAEDEDQRRVLKMVGFLLDAYHKVRHAIVMAITFIITTSITSTIAISIAVAIAIAITPTSIATKSVTENEVNLPTLATNPG